MVGGDYGCGMVARGSTGEGAAVAVRAGVRERGEV